MYASAATPAGAQLQCVPPLPPTEFRYAIGALQATSISIKTCAEPAEAKKTWPGKAY